MFRKADLVQLKGYPSIFYNSAILNEIRSRYEVVALLDDQFEDSAQVIIAYLNSFDIRVSFDIQEIENTL